MQPGQELTLTVSGTGSLPREEQGQPTGSNAGGQDAVPTGPGGGIGNPIGTPDPLTKYKWWILGGMFLGLSAVAGFLLRRPAGTAAAAGGAAVPVPAPNPASRAQRRTAAVAASAVAAQPAARILRSGRRARVLRIA